MKTAILIDSRKDFVYDLTNRIMLDDANIDLIECKSLAKAAEELTKDPSATLYISDSVFIALRNDPSALNILPNGSMVYAFVSSNENIEMATMFGLPCIGLVTLTEKLLEIMLNGVSFVANGIQAFQGGATPAPVVVPPPATMQQPLGEQPVYREPVQQPIPSAPVVPVPPMAQQYQQPAYTMPMQEQTPMNNQNMQQNIPPYSNTPVVQQPTYTPAVQPEPVIQQPYAQQYQPVPPQPVAPPVPQQPVAQPAAQPAMPGFSQEQMMAMFNQFMQAQMGGQPMTMPQQPQQGVPATETEETGAERIQRIHTEKEAENFEPIVTQPAKPKVTTISVYSAKGGVGKTTIASELAVCLALTSNGRRKFRVCIIDYNIDFGDVASTLDLDQKGINMAFWASEIKERIQIRGESPDDIKYNAKEICDSYLQKMKDIDLYTLVAPATHEDSMDICEEELRVMLRNIIECGEFDFVICDTGNNTRDSSVIALESSDYVLMVVTQDVTTANCNDSFLKAMKMYDFDDNRICLVVNNIMPTRETGVSVEEVEETFPYTCVGRIKRTNDIIRANNEGRPLVFNPKHDYTKEMQKIVQFVTSGVVVEEEEEEEKHGFFSTKKPKKDKKKKGK